MKFKEFEYVRIKGTDIFGDIVEVLSEDNGGVYLVHGDKDKEEDPMIISKYNVWTNGEPFYTCLASQLEHA